MHILAKVNELESAAMSIKKRADGAEQPYTGGIFRVRLPFIHYKLELHDILKGVILSVVPLGIT